MTQNSGIFGCCSPFECKRATYACCCTPCIQAKLFTRLDQSFLGCDCCKGSQIGLTALILGIDMIPGVGCCIICCAGANLRKEIINKTKSNRTRPDESWLWSCFYTVCCNCCSLYQQSMRLKNDSEPMTDLCTNKVPVADFDDLQTLRMQTITALNSAIEERE